MWILLFAVALGGAEMPYDGIDQDGDGLDLVDVDGDGYASVLVGGGDCNDRDGRVHPGATDRTRDGVDDDCDGADGEDGEGQRPSASLRASGPVAAACPESGC